MRLRLTWFFGIGALLGSLGGIAVWGATGGSPPAHDEQHQADALVQLLGDKSYRAREQASLQLTDMGLAAEKALSAAERDPNREIRLRARRILHAIETADFSTRLEAFAADPTGNKSPRLPAWDRYQALLGQGASRELFVAMQASQPELMIALDSDPKLASQLLTDYCTNLSEGNFSQADFDSDSPQRDVTVGSLAAILAAAASESVAVEDNTDMQLFSAVLRFNFNSQGKLSGAEAASLKKLIDILILKEHNPAATNEYLQLSMIFGYSSGVQLAERTLAGPSDSAALRSMAILTLGKLGDQREIPLIEKFLSDESPAGASRPGRLRQAQIRDVALAALVRMTGQSWKDYELLRIVPHQVTNFDPESATFADAKKRDAAIERWRNWSAAHGRDLPTLR